MAEGSENGRDDAEASRFVERFALTMVEAGMPRMPARAFAALLASPEGKLTAGELASALHVSPAAVSGAVRYLTQVHMIAREREPGERRDHYRIHENQWYEITTQRDEMLSRWSKDLESGIEAVGRRTAAGRRLDETRRFFEFLRDEMPQLMEKWRAQRAGGA